jgi:hypothetical protein
MNFVKQSLALFSSRMPLAIKGVLMCFEVWKFVISFLLIFSEIIKKKK